jgi:hypothetical protein
MLDILRIMSMTLDKMRTAEHWAKVETRRRCIGMHCPHGTIRVFSALEYHLMIAATSNQNTFAIKGSDAVLKKTWHRVNVETWKLRSRVHSPQSAMGILGTLENHLIIVATDNLEPLSIEGSNTVLIRILPDTEKVDTQIFVGKDVCSAVQRRLLRQKSTRGDGGHRGSVAKRDVQRRIGSVSRTQVAEDMAVAGPDNCIGGTAITQDDGVCARNMCGRK